MGWTALEKGSRSTVVDDIDACFLTPRARDEAERCSSDVWRYARMAVGDLAKVKPLKPHEHAGAEPRPRHSPAVLNDLGRSSPLQTSRTIDDFEEEAVKADLLRSLSDETCWALFHCQDLPRHLPSSARIVCSALFDFHFRSR